MEMPVWSCCLGAMKTEAKELTREEMIAAAAKLSGGETPVAKAADPEPEEKKAEDKKPEDERPAEVEKSVTLTETELSALIEKAVDAGFQKANAFVAEQLAPVSKALEDIQLDVNASMKFQGATTAVLTNFKAGSDDLATEVASLREITKSIQVDVTAIGDQPATPRSAVIEKAADTADKKPEIDLDKINEIAKGMSPEDATSAKLYARRGMTAQLASMLTPAQRRDAGLA